MTPEPWWNVWTLKSSLAEELVVHTVQSASKPVQGGHDQWGEIYTVAGPYKTKADAAAALAGGTGPPPNSTGPKEKIPVVSNVSDFLSRLSQGSTWIRIAEGVLGLVLIAIGLARITHAVPIATSIAKKAGALGVLA